MPKIRPMTQNDKEAVMRFLRVIPEFKPIEVTVAEELIDCYLEDPFGSGYRLAVAETDSSVTGYVCYGPTPLTEGTWDVYWIAVAPEAQGKGVGKAIMDFTEEKITNARGRLILIETSAKPQYEKTRKFYQSIGYTEVSRIPDFYEPGDDRLILMKKVRLNRPSLT